MLPGLISLYTQGTSKEVAIVVGDSDSFSSGSEIDEDEPLQVKGESRMQTKYGNVYYHCKPECVWMRCSFFIPSDLQVPPETSDRLTPVHKAHLFSLFGLQL